MPPLIINGIYTRNFPDLGRSIADTDLFVVADPDSDITYKVTGATLRTWVGVGLTITGTFDGSNEYTLTAPEQALVSDFPTFAVYDSAGVSQPVQYDNTNKKLIGGSGTFTAKFI